MFMTTNVSQQTKNITFSILFKTEGKSNIHIQTSRVYVGSTKFMNTKRQMPPIIKKLKMLIVKEILNRFRQFTISLYEAWTKYYLQDASPRHASI